MAPYIALIGLPFFAAFLPANDNSKRRRLSFSVFFLVFFLLLSLRGFEVGVDLTSYITMYYYTSATPWASIFTISNLANEVGFTLLQKLCLQIWGGVFSANSFRFFLVVVSLICVVPLFSLYAKESENPVLSIALFVAVAPFSMFFSGLREAVAISFGAWAWACLSNKKYFSYFTLVFLAFLFHRSAVVLLAMLPLYHLRIKYRHIPFILVCFILVFLLRIPLFSALARIIPHYNDRYGSNITNTGAFGTLLLLILFCFFCFFVPDEKKMCAKDYSLRNMLVLTAFIQCFSSINTAVMRVNYYYLIFLPVVIPRIVAISKANNKGLAKIGTIVMTLFFLSFFIYRGYNGGDILNVFPYVPYWKSNFHHPYSFIESIFNPI